MDYHNRPRTSLGVDANTTFRPGMWTNHASSCCACCAPGDQPAPPCVRKVTGTESCPPDMYRCLAAWLTICSVASVRKSSYMISATGRIPCIAAPIAAPASAISEIGVLRTRSGPNSSSIPCVTPIEPHPLGPVRVGADLPAGLAAGGGGLPGLRELLLRAVALGVADVVPGEPV